MESRARLLVIMGLLFAAPAMVPAMAPAAAPAVAPAVAHAVILRQRGASAALTALAAGAPAPAAAFAPTPYPGTRSVTAHMAGAPQKLVHAAPPRHAHPAGAGWPALPPVHTGGTRFNMDGIASGAAAGVTGALGEHQFVQLADGQMALYGKHDGVLQGAPLDLRALFSGTGPGACGAPSGAPATIEYDHLAKRWIVARLASAGEQSWHCIAVSATADAGGSYYRYAMPIRAAGGEVLLADDAQMALWPDAYMFTFTLFEQAHGRYRGPRICGIARAALLKGGDALMRCTDPGSAFGPVRAASLQGDRLPPKGTAALIVSLDFTAQGSGERLLLWRFAFASASIGAPLGIPVAPFRIACADAAGAPCIAQPAPGAMLGVPGDRLAPRVIYRHEPGRESLLLTHAVQQADGRNALRWYELRNPLHAAQVYQQGTHASDAGHSAMGSIGVDKAGNIALGYAVAGADTPPGARYSGRQRSDPPGRMQAEEIIVNGTGVQTGAAGALAASGALALDPADGCTFWYTQQYLPVTGHATWRTRIASFKFRSCL